MQKKLAVLAVVMAAGLSTSACVIIDADHGGKRDVTVKINDSDDLESIYAVGLEKGELVARVSSNGCTKAEDFKVEANRRDSVVAITLVRERPDLCRALVPEGKDVRFDLDGLGVQRNDRIRVRNPLQRP
ncbi:hypothetical protein DMC25_22765 [Caulobacter sp. D4A]|uniref:hypothetical protein n=1 Tax=unclassified Caulobacter TaxID=2648921 RepID=UPI000D72740F|nr:MULTISPECIES: hypothetical protein [unclassified Caulobacter]PXA78112.1 hypothetical protein DMC25_22765 [Caulobacter sp. D4A]PXA92724.1 hypothetical protein DMC18_10280 [Caulobacter sp. D5]